MAHAKFFSAKTASNALQCRRRPCRKDHKLYFACQKLKKRDVEPYFVPLHCAIKRQLFDSAGCAIFSIRQIFHNYSDIKRTRDVLLSSRPCFSSQSRARKRNRESETYLQMPFSGPSAVTTPIKPWHNQKQAAHQIIKADGPKMWSAGCVEQWMPTAAMVATNVVIAVMTALLKQALNQGMNRLVLITFRQMLATVFLGPIAYFKERKTRPKITAEIFAYLFLSGILGPVLLQYTLFVGLEYTTATFAATFGNLLPVVTFLISLAFGYEALEVRSKSGSAKISGTLLSLTGAMMLTFYKGASLTHHLHHLPPPSAAAGVAEQHRSAVRWVLGSASMLANVVGFAGWLLLQRRLTRLYPAVYSATALMSLLSFAQAAALALSTQWGAGVAAWRLRGTVEIAAVVYCGVVASGVGYLLLIYCVEKRGPVFTAAFSPLAQMFVAGIDLCVLHEPLYLGSVLGSVLVILGLYLVLWGKREEAAAAAAAAPAKTVEAAAGHGDVAEHQERV